MKKMSVAFIPTQLPGITMYRFNNYTKYMRGVNIITPKFDMKGQKQLHEWEFFLNDKSILDDLSRLINASDMIVFQRTLNPQPAILSILDAIREHNKTKPMQRKYIGMEIDDNMLNVPDGNPAKSNYYAGSPLFSIGMAQLQSSDFVVCSTKYLAELYKQYNPNCLVAGNAVDMEWWGKVKNNNKKNKKIRIGWAGANSHREDLKLLDPVIDEILAKHGDKVEFFFYTPTCDLKERKGLVVEKGYVDLPKYPEKLKSFGFDIGVAPLLDHQFNRSKSAIRYMELSLLGIPSVCSDIGGEFNEAIKHGENGYLAKTQKDFVKYLSDLIENKELRENMGKMALENVLTNYNAKSRAKDYIVMLEQARSKTDAIRGHRE